MLVFPFRPWFLLSFLLVEVGWISYSEHSGQCVRLNGRWPVDTEAVDYAQDQSSGKSVGRHGSRVVAHLGNLRRNKPNLKAVSTEQEWHGRKTSRTVEPQIIPMFQMPLNSDLCETRLVWYNSTILWL